MMVVIVEERVLRFISGAGLSLCIGYCLLAWKFPNVSFSHGDERLRKGHAGNTPTFALGIAALQTCADAPLYL